MQKTHTLSVFLVQPLSYLRRPKPLLSVVSLLTRRNDATAAVANKMAKADDNGVDRVYERRPKASVPALCNHFTIYQFTKIIMTL